VASEVPDWHKELVPGDIVYLIMWDTVGRHPLQGMLIEQGDSTVIVAVPVKPQRAAGAEGATSGIEGHSVKSSLGTLNLIGFHSQNLFEGKDDDDELADVSDDENDPRMTALSAYTRQMGAASSSARPTAAGGGEAASATPDLSGLIQLQMLKEMKRMQKKESMGNYSGAGGGDDEFRILKSLGNLRNLKISFENPAKISREYNDEWEERLEAKGRAWTWRDAAKDINGAKYRSMASTQDDIKKRTRGMSSTQDAVSDDNDGSEGEEKAKKKPPCKIMEEKEAAEKVKGVAEKK
jgi:hypothetical protein